MKMKSRDILAILLAGMWINLSEFLRNEYLLKAYWVNHYKSLGLMFPAALKNGLVWAAWGFLFAFAIYLIARKFSLLQTTLISWLAGFVLMWLVIWNLGVLPRGILLYAVPLSLLEAFVAALICKAVSAGR